MKKSNIREVEITKEMYEEAKKIENLWNKTAKMDCRTEEFKKLNNKVIELSDKFEEEVCDDFDTLEIVNEYERRMKKEKEENKQMEDKKMMNYYNEMRNDIEEAIKYDYAEVLANATDKEDAYEVLYEIFFIDDAVTGNASGSYYFSSYESRKHCYNYSDDVKNALGEFGYTKMLEKFQIFENACDYGYIDIENMEIDSDTFDALDEYDKEDVLVTWEEVQDLDFETIDVITRGYLLTEVLNDILDEIY